jgi:hypothetical protein
MKTTKIFKVSHAFMSSDAIFAINTKEDLDEAINYYSVRYGKNINETFTNHVHFCVHDGEVINGHFTLDFLKHFEDSILGYYPIYLKFYYPNMYKPDIVLEQIPQDIFQGYLYHRGQKVTLYKQLSSVANCYYNDLAEATKALGFETSSKVLAEIS